MVHSFHDRAEVVGRSEGDLDHVQRSHRRVQRLLVGGREDPGPVPQGVGLPQEPEEVPVPLEGTGKVVHDHTGVMLLQEGDEIEGAVLDLCQERRGGRQTLAIEGLAEGVNELRVGVEDRHGRPCRRTRHVDHTFLAEPEEQSQRPSRGNETCRGEPERRRDYRGGLRGAVSGAGGAPHCTSRRAVATFKPARVRAFRLKGASRTYNESTVDL